MKRITRYLALGIAPLCLTQASSALAVANDSAETQYLTPSNLIAVGHTTMASIDELLAPLVDPSQHTPWIGAEFTQAFGREDGTPVHHNPMRRPSRHDGIHGDLIVAYPRPGVAEFSAQPGSNRGGGTVYPDGTAKAFAPTVPEPATATLFLTGFATMIAGMLGRAPRAGYREI